METTKAGIKIGVLFSQTGPMAVTENAHLQGVLLACDEINKAGGIDGKLLNPIILDPAGDDNRYAELATELLLEHGVNVIFGCCLSSSRKAVLPIVERFNGILFYPSVYEGFEYSPNVIYGGGVPNQLILPLLEYIYSHYGRRVALIGLDYLYPREINRIVTEFLDASEGEVVVEEYLPFNVSDVEIKTALQKVIASNPDVILSTVVGQDGINLYTAYADLSLVENKAPIASLTAVESAMTTMEEHVREGHLVVAPYFAAIESEANKSFVNAFHARFGAQANPCVFSEIAFSLVHIFTDGLRLAKQFDTDSILAALSKVVFKSPAGDRFIDIDTNHISLRPFVAKSTKSGQYEMLLQDSSIIKPDPYLVTYDRFVKTQAVKGGE